MRYKIINILLVFLLVIFGINLFRSWDLLHRRGDIILEAQMRLQQEKDNQENLKRQLARVQSNQYIEKEARNKLNLGREGEMILLLPTVSPFIMPSPTPIDTSGNWEKWMKMFL